MRADPGSISPSTFVREPGQVPNVAVFPLVTWIVKEEGIRKVSPLPGKLAPQELQFAAVFHDPEEIAMHELAHKLFDDDKRTTARIENLRRQFTAHILRRAWIWKDK